MRLCGGCRAVRYCTLACQRQHWAVHRAHCAPRKGSIKEGARDVGGRPRVDREEGVGTEEEEEGPVMEVVRVYGGDSDPRFSQLVEAVRSGESRRVLQVLHEHPALLNARLDSHGATPLMWAVQAGKEEVVSSLLRSPLVDADLRMGGEDEDELSPLFVAAEMGQSGIVALLLEERPSLDANCPEGSRGVTPLWSAASRGDVDMLRLLLDKGGGRVDVNARVRDVGVTPLVAACEYGHAQVVEALLRVPSIDVEAARLDTGERPLHAAARAGHVDCLELLLAHGGPDVNAADAEGLTALGSAAQAGHAAIVERLLRVPRVDRNAKDIVHGATPILHAVLRADEECVRLLAEAEGVDLNACLGVEGLTPLMLACHTGRVDLVRRLLERRGAADANRVAADGTTAAWAAANQGHSACLVALLKAYGADLDLTVPRFGNGASVDATTALGIALRKGHAQAAQVLVMANARP